MGEHEAVVWVWRSAWERVTLRDEFVGRFSLASRFPQYLLYISIRIRIEEGSTVYLMTAMFTGAVVLAR